MKRPFSSFFIWRSGGTEPVRMRELASRKVVPRPVINLFTRKRTQSTRGMKFAVLLKLRRAGRSGRRVLWSMWRKAHTGTDSSRSQRSPRERSNRHLLVGFPRTRNLYTSLLLGPQNPRYGLNDPHPSGRPLLQLVHHIT